MTWCISSIVLSIKLIVWFFNKNKKKIFFVKKFCGISQNLGSLYVKYRKKLALKLAFCNIFCTMQSGLCITSFLHSKNINQAHCVGRAKDWTCWQKSPPIPIIIEIREGWSIMGRQSGQMSMVILAITELITHGRTWRDPKKLDRGHSATLNKPKSLGRQGLVTRDVV